MQQKSKWPRNAVEDDPVLDITKPRREERHDIKGSPQSVHRRKDASTSQNLEAKNDTISKAAPKAFTEEKTSTIELAQGYSVGAVQGKAVTFALNAPTNVLTTLMGKDP